MHSFQIFVGVNSIVEPATVDFQVFAPRSPECAPCTHVPVWLILGSYADKATSIPFVPKIELLIAGTPFAFRSFSTIDEIIYGSAPERLFTEPPKPQPTPVVWESPSNNIVQEETPPIVSYIAFLRLGVSKTRFPAIVG